MTGTFSARAVAGQRKRSTIRWSRRWLWPLGRVATKRPKRDLTRAPGPTQSHEQLELAEVSFVLGNDPDLASSLVSHLEELVRGRLTGPDKLALLGVSLHEAIANAAMHGNLELSSDLRVADEEEYCRLARERREQGPYASRRVFVTARFTHADVTFVIRDEGPGFDPKQVPDPTDQCNLGRASGRGLLLIRTFMDHVAHNEKGNEITMIKRCTGVAR
jgi:anti-sigma regulatory factor (Ser/Thr protein kinase)